MLKGDKRAKAVAVKKVSKFLVSTKMKRMLELLESADEESDGKDKTIIFSQVCLPFSCTFYYAYALLFSGLGRLRK